ncbi:DNA-binding response regulator [Flavobacterium magnum]|uniref:DNA-binding response regulator n=1 Tax=Flavobacterium magnum TaxID=2162713 RepID=A0A2S0RBX3_9FLAO|nr:response regulator [Flavobacterium magnum]AWA29105.1 DNA-binding response regulator [Flavobacterium magnum]
MLIRILMIDDHPSQIEGYKVILSLNDFGYEIETTAVYNSENAYALITHPAQTGRFDVAFIDLSLPPFPEKNIHSGEDLALLVRRHWPKTKIIMITSHAEAFILYTLIRKIAPEGLMVKSDFNGDGLLKAFGLIVSGEQYYSDTVNSGVKELLSRQKYLDDVNREIITLLSQGVKMKNMPEILGISKSAIEKRKQIIKDYLCIEKGEDEDIIREAKRLGFI